MIKTVHNWLRQYPGLEAITAESLSAAPGSAGLYCLGLEEVSRESNILGKETCRRRLRFRLSVHCTGAEMPETLLDLHTWAQATAPVLGENQTVTVERGRMARLTSSGTARYDTDITFTFTSEV